MKNITVFLACLVLSAVLLLSCGTAGDPEETKRVGAEESVSAETADEKHEHTSSESGETPADTENGSADGQCEIPDRKQTLIHNLYDGKDLSLDLYTFVRSDTGKEVATVMVTPHNDEVDRVSLNGITVNGNAVLSEVSVSMGIGKARELYGVNLIAGDIGWDGIKSLSFKMTVLDKDFNILSDEVTVDASFPDGLEMGPIVIPYLGAKAARQILYEDERAKITVLSLGNNTPGENNLMTCELLAENKSSEPLTVAFPCQIVNGIAMGFGRDSQEIGPGGSAFFKCSSYSVSFEELGITSIGSYAVQISFGEEDAISSFVKGGTVYPITLSESGDETHRELTDNVILEDDGLKVAELVPNEEETEKGYCPIAIINKENVAKWVAVREIDANGNLLADSEYRLMGDDQLPPDSVLLSSIGTYEEPDGKEHTFRLQVITHDGTHDTDTFKVICKKGETK